MDKCKTVVTKKSVKHVEWVQSLRINTISAKQPHPPQSNKTTVDIYQSKLTK